MVRPASTARVRHARPSRFDQAGIFLWIQTLFTSPRPNMIIRTNEPLIFTHIFQNMGMTIALLPITGVPLPLISYSGSFVLMIMFGLGLVNSVWIHRKISE